MYKKRLEAVIPGGSHTYSRGADQFSSNSPQLLVSGSGCTVKDVLDNEYIDYGMGLRSVNIGYGNLEIAEAAFNASLMGNNLTRASHIELEAAERLVDIIESIDMVKFTKNGSTATTAAIKLSRAYTNRVKIVRCKQHPFFSYDDWFISSTPMKRGIPDNNNTLLFNYNDIVSLEKIFEENSGEIACVILEPSTTEHPKDNFLQMVKDLCRKEGAVFILDEMITGFRWHIEGAQKYYNVEPDLCTFGKAMANGFSVAAVGGKKEIMDLGSINSEGSERLFFVIYDTRCGDEWSSCIFKNY